MTSAVLLNAVAGLIITGGWALVVAHVYRSLAADSRRAESLGRRTVHRHAEAGMAGMGQGAVPTSSLPVSGLGAAEDQEGERDYSLTHAAS